VAFLLHVHIESGMLSRVDFLNTTCSTNVNLVEGAIVLPIESMHEAVHIYAEVKPAISTENLSTNLDEERFSFGFDSDV